MSAVLKDHHPAKTATLHELAAEYHEHLAILADADVPPEVVFDTLEAMQGELVDKVDAVLAYAANLDAIAAARKAEAERLAKSAKAFAARVDSLHTYVQIILSNTGIKLPLATRRFTVNLAKNPPSSEVTSEADLPSIYKSERIEIIGSIGTAAALEALRAATDTPLAKASIDCEIKVDKKELLNDLKQVAAANSQKPEGEKPDAIPGARMQPTSYRLTVR